jgi:hypothetical protein
MTDEITWVLDPAGPKDVRFVLFIGSESNVSDDVRKAAEELARVLADSDLGSGQPGFGDDPSPQWCLVNECIKNK